MKRVVPVPELKLLITSGSDKVVRFWYVRTRHLIVGLRCSNNDNAVNVHADADATTARDLSDVTAAGALRTLGTVSAHSRPVQCIEVDALDARLRPDEATHSATLYTADSMGAILIWTLERTYGANPGCRTTQIGSVSGHRTGVNDMWYEKGELWTGG